MIATATTGIEPGVVRVRNTWQQALMLHQRAQDEHCQACATLAAITAFAALEAALGAMRDAGVFNCRSQQMKKLMIASTKQKVAWLDYPRMVDLVDRRNHAAHGRLMLEPCEARQFIELIAAQFIAWGI